MYTACRESSSFWQILQVECMSLLENRKPWLPISHHWWLLPKRLNQVQIKQNQTKSHSSSWSRDQHPTTAPVTMLACFSYTTDFIAPVNPCLNWIWLVLFCNFLLPCEANISLTLRSAVGWKRWCGFNSRPQRVPRPCGWLWQRECEKPRHSSLAPFRCGMVWMLQTLLLLLLLWYPRTPLQTSRQRHPDWRSRLQKFVSRVFPPGSCLLADRWCWWDFGICSKGLKKFAWK